MGSLAEFFNINNTYDLITQIIGFIALTIAMISYQMKTQKMIVTLQTVACAIFAIHFFMLTAYTGMILNIIASVRSFVFSNKDKKWAQGEWWLYFFCIVCVVAVVFTWEGIISLLPLAGMLFTTFSESSIQPYRVRLLAFPSSPLWIIYNFICHSYAGILTECFVMCSIISAMIRLDLPVIKAKLQNK